MGTGRVLRCPLLVGGGLHPLERSLTLEEGLISPETTWQGGRGRKMPTSRSFLLSSIGDTHWWEQPGRRSQRESHLIASKQISFPGHLVIWRRSEHTWWSNSSPTPRWQRHSSKAHVGSCKGPASTLPGLTDWTATSDHSSLVCAPSLKSLLSIWVLPALTPQSTRSWHSSLPTMPYLCCSLFLG